MEIATIDKHQPTRIICYELWQRLEGLASIDTWSLVAANSFSMSVRRLMARYRFGARIGARGSHQT